jgi:4-amino-4-deoxy-L-arabinose transferase-like glycosyltransferase
MLVTAIASLGGAERALQTPSPRARLLDAPVSVWLLVLLHVLVWTWAGTVVRGNLDLSGDMVEAFVWGQHWQWGYFKHPPLSGWIAGAWFAVFPATHVSFALLASLTTAAGLAGFALLAREFLAPRWVLVSVAAAMLAPGMTSMAMRFNCNSVLVATWPWLTLFFVRFMQHGRSRDALACGVAAALAMLGKYFSSVWIVSLLLCALMHAPWRARLASRGAWLMAAAFAIAFAPHVVWLADHHYGPLEYARQATQDIPGSRVARAGYFVAAQLLLPALGYLLLWLSTRLRRGNVLQMLAAIARPSTDPLWTLAALPLVATALGTIASGARTSVVWGLPMCLGLVLLVASRLRDAGARVHGPRALAVLALAWCAVVVGAPLVWRGEAAQQSPVVTDPRQELAQAVDARWREAFGTPLAWVAGSPAYAASTAFYAPSRPGYWSLDRERQSPWVDIQQVQRDGSALVCDQNDASCQRGGAALGARREIVTVAKIDRGWHFPARDFVLFLIPPDRATAPGPASL